MPKPQALQRESCPSSSPFKRYDNVWPQPERNVWGLQVLVVFRALWCYARFCQVNPVAPQRCQLSAFVGVLSYLREGPNWQTLPGPQKYAKIMTHDIRRMGQTAVIWHTLGVQVECMPPRPHLRKASVAFWHPVEKSSLLRGSKHLRIMYLGA